MINWFPLKYHHTYGTYMYQAQVSQILAYIPFLLHSVSGLQSYIFLVHNFFHHLLHLYISSKIHMGLRISFYFDLWLGNDPFYSLEMRHHIMVSFQNYYKHIILLSSTVIMIKKKKIYLKGNIWTLSHLSLYARLIAGPI